MIAISDIKVGVVTLEGAKCEFEALQGLALCGVKRENIEVRQQCKHNVNYWMEGRYYGFGASAHCFVQNVRKSNVFSIVDYISKPNVVEAQEVISLQEEASEFVMLSLRLAQGFSLEEFQRRFGLNFFQQFPQSAKLLEGGFLQHQDGRIFVPSSKFYVLNSILAELL